jgi:hypothetical protein
MIELDDPDYIKKLEEQKKKREEMLRLKEEKRSQRVLELKKNENVNTSSEQSFPVATNTSSGALNESSNLRNVIVGPTSAAISAGNRIITAINSTISLNTSNRSSNGAARKLQVKNLSLNTTEKSLLNMGSKINLREKVIR